MSAEFPSSIVSVEPFEFCGRAKVWSYAQVEIDDAPPRFKEYAPYIVAIVELEEGPLKTAQLTDLDWHWESTLIDGEKTHVKKFHVEIGMPVEMVTRKLYSDGELGMLIYGDKFRPVLQDRPTKPQRLP